MSTEMNTKTDFDIFKVQKSCLFTSLLISISSISILFPNAVKGERVLTSPKLTDWGQWGPWDFCPQGTFVTGMRLHTQPSQGVFKDDKGLTGIQLFCNKFGKTTQRQIIKSSVDLTGQWGNVYFCRKLMTGFQLRSEKFRSALIDDTAGNNVRMFCDYDEQLYKEGDGTEFGAWTEKRLCEKHEAICGIRTQIEKSNSWDQTGLNNVQMKCCDIPHPVHNCVPKTTWDLVATCEGSAHEDKACKYSRKIGISYIGSYSDYIPLHEAVGYGLRNMITQFQSRFLNVSLDVSFESMRDEDLKKESYWLLSPNYIWDLQNVEKAQATAKKGTKIAVYQIHGKCGMLEVWGSKLKRVKTEIGHAETTFTDFSNENELEYIA